MPGNVNILLFKNRRFSGNGFSSLMRIFKLLKPDGPEKEKYRTKNIPCQHFGNNFC
jgi:hypothetical protein